MWVMFPPVEGGCFTQNAELSLWRFVVSPPLHEWG
jgi:hypothetical protein